MVHTTTNNRLYYLKLFLHPSQKATQKKNIFRYIDESCGCAACNLKFIICTRRAQNKKTEH